MNERAMARAIVRIDAAGWASDLARELAMDGFYWTRRCLWLAEWGLELDQMTEWHQRRKDRGRPA